jgi:hypothetical protein
MRLEEIRMGGILGNKLDFQGDIFDYANLKRYSHKKLDRIEACFNADSGNLV